MCHFKAGADEHGMCFSKGIYPQWLSGVNHFVKTLKLHFDESNCRTSLMSSELGLENAFPSA